MRRATDDDFRVHQLGEADRRRDRRDIAILVGAVVLILGLIAWVTHEQMRTPEVTLEPVTVEMSDPMPCVDDPEVRQLYVELGVTCRSLDR